jgi:signal transduction histidine kinase
VPVSNAGPVIADPDRLLEPFVRGDSTRRGAGLGLSIRRTVVAAHGGTLSLVARPSGGLDVTVLL